MRLNDAAPDFAPRGTLALKAVDRQRPGHLAARATSRCPPSKRCRRYNEQITALAQQIGAVIPRQNMKDKSGASDRWTRRRRSPACTGTPCSTWRCEPLEANFALPLVHESAGRNDRAMLDIAVAAEINLVGDPALAAADAAREAGNSPNTVMAAAAAIIGPKRVERALAATRKLIDLFAHAGLNDARDESFDTAAIPVDAATRACFLATDADADDPRPEAMLAAVRARGGQSVFLKFIDRPRRTPSRATLSWPPSPPPSPGDR